MRNPMFPPGGPLARAIPPPRIGTLPVPHQPACLPLLDRIGRRHMPPTWVSRIVQDAARFGRRYQVPRSAAGELLASIGRRHAPPAYLRPVVKEIARLNRQPLAGSGDGAASSACGLEVLGQAAADIVAGGLAGRRPTEARS